MRGDAYLDAPAIVTHRKVAMNAVACAHAVDDILFHLTDLKFTDAESAW